MVVVGDPSWDDVITRMGGGNAIATRFSPHVACCHMCALGADVGKL